MAFEWRLVHLVTAFGLLVFFVWVNRKFGKE